MKLKYYFLFFSFLFTTSYLLAQNLNVQFRSQLQYPNESLANICGYVDTLGNEYALVGASKGMSIVDVTNPASPVEVIKIPGPDNLWKEIKVRGKYAYVTTEGGGGLQIVNLTSLPNTSGITFKTWQGNGAISGNLDAIHALHIDNNFIYLYGSNLFNGGAVVADITDPWNPVYVGKYENTTSAYIHDGYVRNDTLYGSHIYDGFFSVVDFTNKSNPIELANQYTPTKFTHNTWLSNDSKVLFTTDENNGSFLASYDLSNLNNIAELDRMQTTPGSNSIIHNTHIINVSGNDYAVTSWYTDGFNIVDAGRPHNLVEVARYDTYNGSGPGFHGAWGVYPYLTSGTIVVSNIDEGLFVLSPTYVRACYLEGLVTDSVTGLPISGATVEIQTNLASDISKITGDYATGLATPGVYSVKYSKPGYYSKTITGITLSPGNVTIQNVQLAPLVSFPYNIHVYEFGTGLNIDSANVWVYNSGFDFQATTDSFGNVTLPAIYSDSYNIVVGHWGHITNCTLNNISASGTINIALMPGYYDDFTFDFNWKRTGDAPKGKWVREVPEVTIYSGDKANPDVDDSTDCKNICYVTGNGGSNAGQNDVDDGSTIITSPVFDLTNYTNPTLNYSRWFYVGGGGSSSGPPRDSITITLKDANNSVQIDFSNDSATGMSAWFQKSFLISNYMTPSSTMQLVVKTRDRNPGNIVEGGFDKFFITGSPVGISEIKNNNAISAYPNPFTNEITISYNLANFILQTSLLEMYDIAGRLVASERIQQKKGVIVLEPNISEGVYFVRINDGFNFIEPIKVVKVK